MEFEFVKEEAANMLDSVADTLENIKDTVEKLTKQANDNEQAATDKEAEAQNQLASIHHYKTETRTKKEKDADGNEHDVKYTVTVIDEIADAAAEAAAVALQAAADALRAIAASLRGTSTSLEGNSIDLEKQKKLITLGIKNTTFAIGGINFKLSTGVDLIKKVTSAFYDVSQTDNKVEWAKNVGSNLLKIVGVDLSDGLGDELDSALDIASKYVVDLGRVAVKSTFTSLGAALPGPISLVGGVAFYLASDWVIEKYLNYDTGAKAVKSVMVSALGALGIDATPTVKGQTGNNNAELEDIPVIDITEFAKYADTDQIGANTTTNDNTPPPPPPESHGISAEGKAKLEEVNAEWKKRDEYIKSQEQRQANDENIKKENLNQKNQAPYNYLEALSNKKKAQNEINNNQDEINKLNEKKTNKQSILDKSPGLNKKTKDKIQGEIDDINNQINELKQSNEKNKKKINIYDKQIEREKNIMGKKV